MHRHEKSHIYYTLFAGIAELIMVSSLHFLPSVNLSGVGHAIGISMFGVYAVVSLAYIRNSLLEAVRVKEDFSQRGPDGMN